MRCTFPALLLAFVSPFLAARAGAQPDAVEVAGAEASAVRFEAPAGCGDVDALRRATRALLAGPIPVDAELDGRVESTPEGFRLRLRLGGSERDLRAADCAALLDAAALVWALSIDPVAALQSAAESNAPGSGSATSEAEAAAESGTPPEAVEALAGALADPSAAASAPVASAPASAAPRDASPAHPRRYRLRTAFNLDAGALPSVSTGAELELALRLERVRVSVGARGFRARRGRVQAGGSAYGDIGLGAGFVSVGVPFGRGRMQLEARTTLEIGALWARGGGVAFPGRGRAAWVAAGLGLGAQLDVGRGFALVAHADAFVPLNRPLFVIDGVGSVYRPGSVSLRASLGLAFHFGSRVSS
ncbi:MAG: hypothetical protein GXP55_02495 [Deltaproteobacteria bacterium]|nr:hypothetical protein [Deltaproteobacteria bacterium]